ncbi:hypothetical protein GCM10027447_05120 [Glycomyces halotolerans]
MGQQHGQASVNHFQSGENYRDPSNLAVRQRLYDYKSPDYDLPGIVSSHIKGEPAKILDVGCGNGQYVRRLRADFPATEVIAVDKAPAMLESTRSFRNLSDAEFDRVMAQIGARLEEYFAEQDLLRITSHSGILECRKPSQKSHE